MEQRHDTADQVLCVVSDDYLKAPWSTLERNAVLWQAASSRPRFVLLGITQSSSDEAPFVAPSRRNHQEQAVLRSSSMRDKYALLMQPKSRPQSIRERNQSR